jgi:hypothetical protein
VVGVDKINNYELSKMKEPVYCSHLLVRKYEWDGKTIKVKYGDQINSLCIPSIFHQASKKLIPDDKNLKMQGWKFNKYLRHLLNQ